MTRVVSRAILYSGCLAIVGGLAKVHAARHGYDLTSSSRFVWAGTYVALLCIAAYANGVPDVVRPGWSAVARSMSAIAAAAVAVSLVQLVVGDALLPRFVVFGTAAAMLPLALASVAVANRGRLAAQSRDRILLVAEQHEVDALRAELDEEVERHASVVAALGPKDACPGPEHAAPLVELAAHSQATVLVLSRAAQDRDAVVHQAASLHESGLRLRTLSQFYEEWLGKLPISELERVSLFFDISEVHRSIYSRGSRLFDLGLAAIGMLALAPLAVFVMAGNVVANRGPLFYKQARVGKHGKVFEIYKFRTMRPSPSGLVNEWTSEDDPRITPFGRVLRRTHLDELPQVINIIKGDLSVVGPRPEQPHYVEELVAKLPFYELRHLVRPGLTGWAQVKYGYAGNESDALQKLQYEFFYLRYQTLALDMRIVIRTLRSVFGRRGR